MADHDGHLEELARQCANYTQLSRLNQTEQLAVLHWLIDGGHLTRTGKPLEKPRVMPRVVARKSDGSPVYDPGADFSPTEPVKMGAR
jgi:hypothetical protein